MPHTRVPDYVQQLQRVLAGAPPGGALALAANALISALANAATLRAQLTVGHVPLVINHLLALAPPERRLLTNPWCPGFGNVDGRLVLAGTEHAIDLENDFGASCLAVADCFLQGFWLADGGQDVRAIAETISGQGPHCRAPLAPHRHPYEFLYRRKAVVTWRRLGTMLGPGGAGLIVRRCAFPMWGEHAYLFELSEYAARGQAGGALPSPERQDYLANHLVPKLTQRQARALVFYGRWNDSAWDALRYKMATAFLGSDADPQQGSIWQIEMVSGRPFRWLHSAPPGVAGARIVVLMHAPAARGRMREYLLAVGRRVAQYI